MDLFNKIICIRATCRNLDIILIIHLTLPISNAGGEKTFSVLKRVKQIISKELEVCVISIFAERLLQKSFIWKPKLQNIFPSPLVHVMLLES